MVAYAEVNADYTRRPEPLGIPRIGGNRLDAQALPLYDEELWRRKDYAMNGRESAW